MSTGATILQILATGGVAAGATGLVLQRAKTRDDVHQWQRAAMMEAVTDLARLGHGAQSVVIGLTDLGRGVVPYEGMDITPDEMAAAKRAFQGKIDEASVGEIKVMLLFGPRSQTAQSMDKWEDAVSALWEPIIFLDHSELPLSRDAAERFREVLERALQRVLDELIDFLEKARGEMAAPSDLHVGTVDRINLWLARRD